jgi:hypothetical protein
VGALKGKETQPSAASVEFHDNFVFTQILLKN